jgi:hypothetical protein
MYMSFFTDTVYGSDVDTVGHSMAALDEFPRLAPVTFRRLFPIRVTDRSRVKNDLGAVKRNAPCRFREPLIVADQNGDATVPRSMHLVPLTRSKIPLFEKPGVLGDMDFMIRRIELPVCINDHGSIVKPPLTGFLKQRDDDHNIMTACNF